VEINSGSISSVSQVSLTMLTEDQQIQFTRLWTETQSTVNHYVASLIHDQSLIRDILQNISLTLLRKFSEYDDSRPFLPWALGVARFEILAQQRDTARKRMICDTEFLEQYTQVWAETETQISDEASALRYCVGQLEGRPQSIIQRRYSDGLTSEIIAKQLSITAANVRTILKRTRDVLKKCVERRLRFQGDAT